MSKATKSSLFMFTPLAKYAGFYQEVLSGTGNYEQLGNRLIRVGEQAHSLRQFDKVKEIGLLLSNVPIKRYQAIGGFFLAVAVNSMGNGDQDEARRLFEIAVDRAPDPYKVKSILSLGALAFHKKDFDSAFYFYQQTIRIEGLGPASLQAIRGITTLKSIEGYHKSAIADVERILPLIRFAPPNVYLDCLNSYAVELSEVGRLQEAENVSSLVIASPLTRYYPEWQDTLSEVRSKRKRRSTVAIPLPPVEEEYEGILEPEAPQNTIGNLRIQTVIDFMNTNLERKMSLSELAKVVNLSPSHLSRLFKNETKLSPGEYLIRLRLEKARHLLATSFLSIKQIMALVGYGNRKGFVGHFKRYFDLTPSKYRKRAYSGQPSLTSDIELGSIRPL
ncbi:MAG: helix-turn-helix domain-containing protein [Acidobacteriota bacterium]